MTDPWDAEERQLVAEWRRIMGPDAVLILQVARLGRGPRLAALRSAVEDARRSVK